MLTRKNLTALLKFTHSESIDPIIGSVFAVNDRVNILYLFMAVVVYGALSLVAKVNVLLYIFDFDGNKHLTEEELGVLASAFIDAVARMTGQTTKLPFPLETLVSDLFLHIDSNNDQKISKQE